MTEDQIERRVERFMDHLDRCFLGGQIARRHYDAAVADLSEWAEAKRKETALTTAQQVVLAYLAVHDAKAMRMDGRWVWADDIRRDPKLAERFVDYTAEKESGQ